MIENDFRTFDSEASTEMSDIENNIFQPENARWIENIRTFLITQQAENFKLHKEIGILNRERKELELGIGQAIERVENLEKNIGIQPTPIQTPHAIPPLLVSPKNVSKIV